MRNNYVFILVLILFSKLLFGQSLSNQINFKDAGGANKTILHSENDFVKSEPSDFIKSLLNYEELTQFILKGVDCDLNIITQPVSKTVCTGEPFTLSVVVGGTPPFYYQWKKGAQSIPGATSDTYTVYSATTADAGGYKCWPGSSCGRIYTNVATIVVNTSIIIDTQPISSEKCSGEDLTLSVTAHGSGILDYQWYKNNIAIEGAVDKDLALVSISNNDAADYYCKISNTCGNVTTEVVQLTVKNLPNITQQPVGAEKCIGTDFTFNVSVTDGSSYQWYFDDNIIDGATENYYNIDQISNDNAGDYYLVITNGCGNVTSDIVTLNVLSFPSIIQQSEDISKCEGSEVIFSVEATANETIEYQWYKGDAIIESETNPSYAISSVAAEDAGSYLCVVSNVCTKVTSENIILTVDFSPNITAQSENGKICLGAEFNFSVAASGTEPITYQWYKNGDAIDQTTKEFTINAVSLSDAGDYYCHIFNLCNEDASNIITLIVDTMPKINLQPENAKMCTGLGVEFSIDVIGSDPLTYKWYKNGSEIPSNENNFIFLNEVSVDDAGNYSCVVSNSCGSVTSNAAELTVDVPPLIIEQSTEGSICLGESLTISLTATGTDITYQWFNNDGIIVNADDSSLEVLTTGDYYCVVSGKCEPAATSETISVNVGIPPQIIEQPKDVEQCAGNSAEFSLVSDGTSLLYQWYLNEDPIVGANERTFTLPNITYPEDAGEYSCKVSNACGSEMSLTAKLIIDNSFIITSTPESLEKCLDANAVFSVAVDGTNIKYQWFKYDASIDGATLDVLHINHVTSDDDADYHVEISNACNSVFTRKCTSDS